MAEVLRMPEVLAGASEAAIQTWLVSAGATLVVDQPIAEIETDKALVELTAEYAGAIGRILIPEGSSVAVGDAIAVLLSDGEGEAAIEAALARAGLSNAASIPDDIEPAPDAPAEPISASRTEDRSTRTFTSPLVRRLASQHEVDLALVSGTGPRGRIVRRDLEQYLASEHVASAPHAAGDVAPAPALITPTQPSTAPAHYEDVPLDRMRKAIARRLTESKSTVPHFYLVVDCRVDALLALRSQINETTSRKISVNDLVLKAAAGALVEVPAANAIWNEDSIRRFTTVDIAVAVATDGGLVTPVLRDVARMPLAELSVSVVDLAERGRGGRLKQHELVGGSLSVSNLGMYGTSQFSAILNPPQSGILAVGAARPMPVVGRDGGLEVGTVMTATLSADHRVLDGAIAAQWLAAFQRRIESPLSILV